MDNCKIKKVARLSITQQLQVFENFKILCQIKLHLALLDWIHNGRRLYMDYQFKWLSYNRRIIMSSLKFEK